MALAGRLTNALVCDRGIQQAAQLCIQYNDRIKECENDHFMRLRAAEWLMDSVTRLVKEVRNEN